MPRQKSPSNIKEKKVSSEPKTKPSKESPRSAKAISVRTAGNKQGSGKISRSAIEKRAWEIWQDEGCPAGRELEHWLRAEKELSQS